MKRLYLLALMSLVVVSSCAATLQVRGTAPAQDNDGTCASPVLVTNLSSSVVVHLTATGPVTFTDSVTVATGTPFSFARSVPAGVYSCRVWASDVGGVGCDTTFTRTAKAPPYKPRVE